MCDTGAAKGIDTRFVLHPLTDRAMNILGISSGQLIGFTSESIAYDPLDRRIAGSVSGSMSYDEVSITLYLRPNTPDQEELRMLASDQVDFSDLWLYYSRKGKSGPAFTHFQALDLAEEPCGKFNIGGWSHQSFTRSDLKQVQFTLTTDGIVAEFDRHTDDVAWTMAGGIITATDADFSASGFMAGMTVIYETGNTSSPYGYGKVSALTATTLTLTDTTLVVASGEGKIHGARTHY